MFMVQGLGLGFRDYHLLQARDGRDAHLVHEGLRLREEDLDEARDHDAVLEVRHHVAHLL